MLESKVFLSTNSVYRGDILYTHKELQKKRLSTHTETLPEAFTLETESRWRETTEGKWGVDVVSSDSATHPPTHFLPSKNFPQKRRPSRNFIISLLSEPRRISYLDKGGTYLHSSSNNSHIQLIVESRSGLFLLNYYIFESCFKQRFCNLRFKLCFPPWRQKVLMITG